MFPKIRENQVYFEPEISYDLRRPISHNTEVMYNDNAAATHIYTDIPNTTINRSRNRITPSVINSLLILLFMLAHKFCCKLTLCLPLPPLKSNTDEELETHFTSLICIAI
jgi:hypothetical protein